jgi:hypothetical protein
MELRHASLRFARRLGDDDIAIAVDEISRSFGGNQFASVDIF